MYLHLFERVGLAIQICMERVSLGIQNYIERVFPAILICMESVSLVLKSIWEKVGLF